MQHFRLGRLAFVSIIVFLVCWLLALPESAVAQNVNALSFGSLSSSRPGGPKSIDPGVRGGKPGAGGPLAGLNENELAFFTAAQNVFMEIDAVPDGLGPQVQSG